MNLRKELVSPVRALRVPERKLSSLNQAFSTQSRWGLPSRQPKKFDFVYQLNAPFKWGREELAFHSVFLGGTDWAVDAVPQIDVILNYLNKIGNYCRLNLFTTVGSCFFFHLVNNVKFKRVILFERNILEMMKVGMQLRDFDQPLSGGVESEFTEYFQELLNLNRYTSLNFECGKRAFWSTRGGPSEVSLPILMSRTGYPDFQVDLEQEERQRVLSRLKNALVREVWSKFPQVNLEREVAVVFLSNIPRSVISDKDVVSSLVNGSGTIIIRSSDTEPDPLLNQSALDPHEYWTAVLESCCTKHDQRVHEVLPFELRKIQDVDYQLECGNFDFYSHDSASFLDEGTEIIPDETSLLILHILLGKMNSSNGMIDRVNMLKNYLVNVPRSVNRVVVAEFNPESKRGKHLQGVFPTVESLKVFYESCLSSFEVLDTKFSPGFGEKKRNVFFVFGKKH